MSIWTISSLFTHLILCLNISTIGAQLPGNTSGDFLLVRALDSDLNGLIYIVDIETKTQTSLPFNNKYYTGLSYDTAENKVYWSNRRSLCRINIDGTDEETVYTAQTIIYGTAIDSIERLVFFTVNNEGSPVSNEGIYTMKIDTKEVTKVPNITCYQECPYIEIDIIDRKIYWTYWKNDDQIINILYSANYDGSQIKKIVSDLAYRFKGLAIDINDKMLYWLGDDKIEKSGIDGSNREVLYTEQTGESLEDVVLGRRNTLVFSINFHMYLSSIATTGGPISRFGGEAFSYIIGGVHRVFRQDCGVPSIPNGSIQVINLAYTKYGALANVSCNAGYSTTKQQIHCLENGSWEKALCKSEGNTTGDFLLVGDDKHGTIYSIDIETTTVKLLPVSTKFTWGLSYDTKENTVYWSGFKQLCRINIDNTNEEIVYTARNEIKGIAIDSNERLVFLSLFENGIFKMNIDTKADPTLVSNIQYGNDIQLDVIERKIYWSVYTKDSNSKTTLYSANYDGSQLKEIVSDWNYQASCLAIDINDKQLYHAGYEFKDGFIWKIETSNMDGSDRKELYSNNHDINGLALIRRNLLVFSTNDAYLRTIATTGGNASYYGEPLPASTFRVHRVFRQDCGVPSIANGHIQALIPTYAKYGALANMTCNAGYSTAYTKYGALANVTCNEGYSTTKEQIHCLENGLWEITLCKGETNFAAIIGGSIGGGIACVTLVCGILIVVKRRRNKKGESESQEDIVLQVCTESEQPMSDVQFDETNIGDPVIAPSPSESSLADRYKRKQYRPPKDACLYDGRLISLSDEDKKEIKDACIAKNKIGRGKYGEVFKTYNNGFGRDIAIKKIKANTDGNENSSRREIHASRILNPFILPLFSTFEIPDGSFSDFYFVSPYCENGDLYGVLEECRKCTDTNHLNQFKRMRIALQLSLAIQYLHTPVPNIRGIILHKDICSSNVALDKNFNARLIDFGLARESDDMTSTDSGKFYYCHPDVGVKPASVKWDYYGLGVVIRELLTGLPPDGKRNIHLRFMKTKDIMENLANIWSADEDEDDGDSRQRRANVLNIAAQKCIEAHEETFCIKRDVIDGIKDEFNLRIMAISGINKCSLCMINPEGSEAATRIKHDLNCKEQIRLCIACEKNSFFNPVTCYSCEAVLEPIIGSGWGALLVAGNDTVNDDNANAFKEDMKSVRKMLISRAPLVMGIREEDVKTVALENPGTHCTTEKLLPLLSTAIEDINKMNIHTLVVYFSCHGVKNEGHCFQLASKDETLTTGDFQEMLSKLETVEKVIVILDRCYAKKITLPNKTVVQINACGPDERAPVQAKASPFTHYFVKGLQAMSEGKCCEEKCRYCEDYWATRKDYITVGSLLEFIASHMTANRYPTPRCKFEGDADDVKLAYYNDEEVCLDFTVWPGHDGNKNKATKQVPVVYCQNMNELKKKLLEKIDERREIDVYVDTYREDNRYKTCDTIDKVMMAWVLRKGLIVKFREESTSETCF